MKDAVICKSKNRKAAGTKGNGGFVAVVGYLIARRRKEEVSDPHRALGVGSVLRPHGSRRSGRQRDRQQVCALRLFRTVRRISPMRYQEMLLGIHVVSGC